TELEDGRVVVTHIVENNEITQDEANSRIEMSGQFNRRRSPLPTPFKQLVFRVLLLTIGRFNANMVRSLLQKILITGKARVPIRWHRAIKFDDDSINITDRVEVQEKGIRFKRLASGSDATSIYVANSNVYQDSVLLPWQW